MSIHTGAIPLHTRGLLGLATLMLGGCVSLAPDYARGPLPVPASWPGPGLEAEAEAKADTKATPKPTPKPTPPPCRGKILCWMSACAP